MADTSTRLHPWLSFRGRCSRAANAKFLLGYLGVLVLAVMIAAFARLPIKPVLIAVVIVALWPSLAFAARRLHDVGLSAWLLLLNLIPLAGMAFAWTVVFKRGQAGPNRYGDDPAPTTTARRSAAAAEWTVAAACGLAMIALTVCLRIFAVQAYTIPSGAMEPSLFEGDYVIVAKSSYGFSRHSIPFSPPLFNGRLFFKPPVRGDIIVFKLPRDPRVDYIKRLIGLPGDRIQIRSGVVFVNDRPMDRRPAAGGQTNMGFGPTPVDRYRETTPEGRSYLTNSIPQDQAAENTGVYVAPPHCYFLLGDNRDNSLDSRFDPGMEGQPLGPANCGWDPSVDAYMPAEQGVGFVPEQNLEGKAIIAVGPRLAAHLRWLTGG